MADRILVMREGRISGEFSRGEATQESVMTAATGGPEREVPRMSERAPGRPRAEGGAAFRRILGRPGGPGARLPGPARGGLLGLERRVPQRSNLESILYLGRRARGHSPRRSTRWCCAGEIDISTGSMLGPVRGGRGRGRRRASAGSWCRCGRRGRRGPLRGYQRFARHAGADPLHHRHARDAVRVARRDTAGHGRDLDHRRPQRDQVLGMGSVLGLSVPVMVLFGLFVVMEVVGRHTTWGRDVYAVGGNRRAARFAGLPTDRVQVLAFVLVGVFVGHRVHDLHGTGGLACRPTPAPASSSRSSPPS